MNMNYYYNLRFTNQALFIEFTIIYLYNPQRYIYNSDAAVSFRTMMIIYGSD